MRLSSCSTHFAANPEIWTSDRKRGGRSCSSPPHSSSLTCCLLNFLPLPGVSATLLTVPSTFIQALWLSLSFFLCPTHFRVFLCWLVGWKRWELGHLLELRRLQLLKTRRKWTNFLLSGATEAAETQDRPDLLEDSLLFFNHGSTKEAITAALLPGRKKK